MQKKNIMETHSKVKVLNLLWFDCDNNNDKKNNGRNEVKWMNKQLTKNELYIRVCIN